MHEISLVEDLVALVVAERLKQDFAQVRIIHMRLGALGPAEPDALRFCFDAVASGTIAQGALLQIEIVPGLGHCLACDMDVVITERFAICPDCGIGGLRVVAGDELRLTELEVA